MTSIIFDAMQGCLDSMADGMEGDKTVHQRRRSEFKNFSRLAQWVGSNQDRLTCSLALVEQPPGDRSNAPSKVLVTFALSLE